MNNSIITLKSLFNITDNKQIGHTLDEINQTENNLCIKLPKSLKDFLIELGKDSHINLNSSYFNFLNLDKIYLDSSKNYLIFCHSKDSNMCWGIPINDIYLDNPNVYINHLGSWELYSTSLENFILTKSLELVACSNSLQYVANLFESSVNYKELDELLNISDYEITNLTVEQEFRLFVKDNVLVFCLVDCNNIDNIIALFINSNNRDNFLRIVDNHSFNWDCVYID